MYLHGWKEGMKGRANGLKGYTSALQCGSTPFSAEEFSIFKSQGDKQSTRDKETGVED